MSWDPNENAALGLALAYRGNGDVVAYDRVVASYRDRFSKVGDLAPKTAAGDGIEKRAALEVDDHRQTTTLAASRRTPTPSRSASGSIDAALSNKDYADCAQRASNRGDALSGGEHTAYGWCLLNLNRPVEAARQFEAALIAATGKARDDAAYGKSLSLLAAGETAPAIAAASEAPLDPERRNALGLQVLERRAWDAFAEQRFAEAMQWLDKRVAFAPETRELMRLRVMCLGKLGRADEAQKLANALEAQLSQQ